MVSVWPRCCSRISASRVISLSLPGCLGNATWRLSPVTSTDARQVPSAPLAPLLLPLSFVLAALLLQLVQYVLRDRRVLLRVTFRVFLRDTVPRGPYAVSNPPYHTSLTSVRWRPRPGQGEAVGVDDGRITTQRSLFA